MTDLHDWLAGANAHELKPALGLPRIVTAHYLELPAGRQTVVVNTAERWHLLAVTHGAVHVHSLQSRVDHDDVMPGSVIVASSRRRFMVVNNPSKASGLVWLSFTPRISVTTTSNIRLWRAPAARPSYECDGHAAKRLILGLMVPGLTVDLVYLAPLETLPAYQAKLPTLVVPIAHHAEAFVVQPGHRVSLVNPPGDDHEEPPHARLFRIEIAA